MDRGQPSFVRTLLVAIVVAALVALPFWLFEEPQITGPVIFAGEEHAAGEVSAVKCPFGLNGDRWVTCYRATVPQTRGNREGDLISIFAVRIEPKGGATRDDPFLYLEGGPGFAGVPDDERPYGRNGWVRETYDRVLESGRAMIFVDTRGLGYAAPALQCPYADDIAWQALKLLPAEREAADNLTVDIACLDALKEKGIDLYAYHSAEVAQDLKALRIGLGIRQWNLYGVSYGAQTALHLLETDRAGVRSVIFDSPSYGGKNSFPDDQAAFDRVLAMVSANCKTDEMQDWCGEGDISERLAALLTRLKETPLTLRGYPFGKPVYLTDREAMTVFHQALYTAYGRDDMVSHLREMEKRRSGYLASLSDWSMDWRDTLYWSFLNEKFSWPVFYATACREQNFRDSVGESRWPVYTADEEDYFRNICDAMAVDWNGRAINASTFQGVPALVYSGNWDVITPPAYGRALADDIRGSYFLHPEESHGLLFWSYDECVATVAEDFLENLTVTPGGDCGSYLEEQTG